MSDTAPPFQRACDLLASARPDDTAVVILATRDHLVCHVGNPRLRELAHAARTLLEHARDASAAGLRGAEITQLHHAIHAALRALPDPLRDDDGDHG